MLSATFECALRCDPDRVTSAPYMKHKELSAVIFHQIYEEASLSLAALASMQQKGRLPHSPPRCNAGEAEEVSAS